MLLSGAGTENVRGYRKCVFSFFIYSPSQVAQLLQSKWELEQDGNGTSAVRIAPGVPLFIYGGCVLLMCLFLSVDVHRDASCFK